MECVLLVAYEDSTNGDFPCLTVCRKTSDNRLYGINSFWGKEAEQLYRKLTKQEGPFNMAAITTPEGEYSLMDLLRQPVHDEKVDSLASDSNGKVNTVPDGDKNMEEYI